MCRYYMVKFIQFVCNLDVFSSSLVTTVDFKNDYKENFNLVILNI